MNHTARNSIPFNFMEMDLADIMTARTMRIGKFEQLGKSFHAKFNREVLVSVLSLWGLSVSKIHILRTGKGEKWTERFVRTHLFRFILLFVFFGIFLSHPNLHGQPFLIIKPMNMANKHNEKLFWNLFENISTKMPN